MAYAQATCFTASKPGLETTEECPRGQNLDSKGLFQFEQVRVASDDEFRPCSQSASKIRVVAGVAGTLFPQRRGRDESGKANQPIQGGSRGAPKLRALQFHLCDGGAPFLDDCLRDE